MPELKKTMANLRNRFGTENSNLMIKRISDPDETSSWELYTQLEFLGGHIKKRRPKFCERRATTDSSSSNTMVEDIPSNASPDMNNTISRSSVLSNNKIEKYENFAKMIISHLKDLRDDEAELAIDRMWLARKHP